MYSNKGLATVVSFACLEILSLDNCINGPPGSLSIEAVPSLKKIIIFHLKRK